MLTQKIELLFQPIQFPLIRQIRQIRQMHSNEQDVFPNPANIFRQEEVQEEVQEVQVQEKVKPSEPSISEPSICIPRMFKSTTRRDIFNVVERLELGAVDRIDMVAKVNTRGESYNKVFIHFKAWNKRNPVAQATRDKLLKGEDIKIVYREPWFWKCTASRVEKPTFRDYSAPPPRIDLSN